MNVVVQRHLMPAPGAQASILPFALSAIDNAYLEEQRAKERETQRHVEKHRFHENTRIFLLQKMQEIEHQKEKEHEETAAKIKQLLADTIEFTQKTAMATKRHSGEGSGGNSSPERSGVIRNLVASPESKNAKFGSPNVKGGAAPAGARFSNVVEHHEEEEEEQEYNAHLHFDSPDAQRNMNDLRTVHKLLHNKSVELQHQFKLH